LKIHFDYFSVWKEEQQIFLAASRKVNLTGQLHLVWIEAESKFFLLLQSKLLDSNMFVQQAVCLFIVQDVICLICVDGI